MNDGMESEKLRNIKPIAAAETRYEWKALTIQRAEIRTRLIICEIYRFDGEKITGITCCRVAAPVGL